jgi:hypothetical protein
MLLLTKIIYISLAFSLWSGSIYTLEADKNKREDIPLTTYTAAPHDAEEEDAEEDSADPMAHQLCTRSQAFCSMANDLIIAFKDYSTLPQDQQEVLIDKWQDLVNFCSAELSLSNAGFAMRIDVPLETGQQLDAIFAIYKARRKSSCVIE